MQQPVQEMMRALEELLAAHDVLFQLEKEKQRALIQASNERLIEILHEESKIINKISKLDMERQRSIDQFLDAQGIEKGQVSLSDLAKLVINPTEKEGLKQVSRRLKWRIEELQELNSFNQQLIEQSLSYIDFTIRLVMEEPDHLSTYQRGDLPARQASGIQRHFFETKA